MKLFTELQSSEMPKITSYTPAWLSKPNPGHEIFTAKSTKTRNTHEPSFHGQIETSKKNAKPGPRRTIARRGTEVFIAVGKEIRWADLVYLKEVWEDKLYRDKGHNSKEDVEDQCDEDNAQGYRVCIHEALSRIMLIHSDDQNTSRRRHTTAHNLSSL